MSDTQEFEFWDFPMPLLVTAGDPAGIGPEVAHRALRRLMKRGEILHERPIAVIGDVWLYARHLNRPEAMQIYHIVPVDDFLADPGYMLHHIEPKPGKSWRPIFLDCGYRDESAAPVGKITHQAGERAASYLGAAMELLADEISDCVCTAPICKEAMDAREFPYAGHTEMFGEAFDVRQPVMLLAGGGLKVALVTIHEPLANVPKLLTRKRLRAVLNTAHEAMIRDFGIPDPRIAVCGLNPHAGEGGRFGEEERGVIRPVIKSLRERDWKIDGPLAADSVFAQAREGEYDLVVAMYHDQGLIPVKTLAFHEGVNVTLGLPVVRTAPDHGTAHGIAGRGQANAGAMYEAIKLANRLSMTRTEFLAED